MSLNLDDMSVVYWFPDRDKHKCGYCKQENCAISYGMWADSLTVDDYQDILDRGWRRSGKYCYKPIMQETCCPQYTIRCDAVNFKLSKSQKKVIKKFNKYLSEGILNKESPEHQLNTSEAEGESHIVMKERPECMVDYKQIDKKIKIDEIKPETELKIAPSCSEGNDFRRNPSLRVNFNLKQNSTKFKRGKGADPRKPPSQKAKLIRLERKRKKLEAKGLSLEAAQKEDKKMKSLTEYLNEIAGDSKHKLEIKLLCTSLQDDQLMANLAIEHKVYQKYQMVIHNDSAEKCSLQNFKRFLVQTPLKIHLVQMNQKQQTYHITAKLFEKYQMQVHSEKKSECGVEQFEEFLVDTPLKAKTSTVDDSIVFGSYHQQYWIDGKLIAVGVIDILPRSVSSVYFFYDPDYRNLTLGTYGSLKEVEYTQKLNKKIPELRHYYMGFYIHSCPKMRYKGKLNPSDLLCPETYEWFPISDCIPKLENSLYSRLNENPLAVDEGCCNPNDIETIRILIGYQYTTFRHYRYKSRDLHIYQTIGKLIGRKSVGRFVFIQQKG